MRTLVIDPDFVLKLQSGRWAEIAEDSVGVSSDRLTLYRKSVDLTPTRPLSDTELETLQQESEMNWQNWYASGVWGNGDPFGCGWLPSQAQKSPDGVNLNLNLSHTPDAPTADMPWSGAEYRTAELIGGFGLYEVTAKVAAGAGVMNGVLFTYLGGDTLDAKGQPCKHKEIDIEILGKQPNVLHTNFFYQTPDGTDTDYPLDIPLLIDASAEFHTYAFTWASDRIVWFVDGVQVREIRAAETFNGKLVRIPQEKQRIMHNIWNASPGDAEKWLGTPVPGNYQLQLKNFKYVPY